MAEQGSLRVASLTEAGLSRVPEAKVGMTFIIEKFTGKHGQVAVVRDYRFGGTMRPYQLWSLSEEQYREIENEETR